MRVRSTIIAMLCCCFTFAQLALAQAVSDQPQAENDQPQTEKEERRQRLLDCATALRLTSAEDENKDYVRHEQPLLHYHNPLFAAQGSGLLVLWHDRSVPVAVASFSERHGDRIFREFSSLTETRLLCTREGRLLWSPQSTGLPKHDFPSAQPPRSTSALRLVQMRRMAERFEVNKGGECRLLSQPLYRFDSPDRGIIDGAIFAFVVANDPELLLTVTLESSGDDLQDATWKYSLARMTSSPTTARLDGQQVWHAPGYWKNPRSKADPYVEGLERMIE